jgi:hypothetical protein
MKRVFQNGRYANVTATLALIVALAGTSYAAITLPARSVGSRQLKSGAVTNNKLHANAVTSAKVRNRSLRAVDFKTGQLPAGAPGATNVVVREAVVPNVPPGEFGKTVVSCLPSETAIGGGLKVGGPNALLPGVMQEIASEPVGQSLGVGPRGWFVAARNTSSPPSPPNAMFAYAVCASP